MRITRRQLRRIIREAFGRKTLARRVGRLFEADPHDPWAGVPEEDRRRLVGDTDFMPFDDSSGEVYIDYSDAEDAPRSAIPESELWERIVTLFAEAIGKAGLPDNQVVPAVLDLIDRVYITRYGNPNPKEGESKWSEPDSMDEILSPSAAADAWSDIKVTPAGDQVPGTSFRFYKEDGLWFSEHEWRNDFR